MAILPVIVLLWRNLFYDITIRCFILDLLFALRELRIDGAPLKSNKNGKYRFKSSYRINFVSMPPKAVSIPRAITV